MLIEPSRNILIGPLLQIAVARCWNARDDWLRLAVVPLVVLLAILAPLARTADVVRDAMTPNGIGDPVLMLRGLMLAIAYGFVIAVFAVNWVRQLTLGTSAAPGLGLALRPRHLRFFCAVLAIAIAAILPVMFLYPVFITVLDGSTAVLAGVAMALLIWAALLARLSPGWIGIAIDAPMSLGRAWRRTAGQGFKLVVAMLAVEVTTMIIQQVITAVFEFSGFAAMAPLTYLLVSSVVDLNGVSVQLALLVTAFPYFLRETV